jgi:16S rRNA (uracil1498-N3)-methyltransferase
MHRFFVAPDQISGTSVVIAGEDFKHITRVLRLGSGDVIEICNGRGTDYEVVLETVGEQTITGKIRTTYASQGENPDMAVTLFQGLPKGPKMEVIIQKGVELGVTAIIPFSSKRAVSQIRDKKEKKTERWQRIAYEAAKQSKRGIIPQIGEPVDLTAVSKAVQDFDLLIMAYEDESRLSLKKALSDFQDRHESGKSLQIAVVIGPEGGFDPTEVEAVRNAGGVLVSLGKRILRTETAGMVVLSQLNFWREGELV